MLSLNMETVPEAFLCTYCSQVVVDPIQHIPCGGYICLECLEFIPDPQKCPKCDDFIADNTDDMNEIDLVKYNRLRFKCSNDCGDNTIMTLRQYRLHLLRCKKPSSKSKQCKYCHEFTDNIFEHEHGYCNMIPIPCAVKGCTIVIPKYKRIDHYIEYQDHHIMLFRNNLQQELEEAVRNGNSKKNKLPRKVTYSSDDVSLVKVASSSTRVSELSSLDDGSQQNAGELNNNNNNNNKNSEGNDKQEGIIEYTTSLDNDFSINVMTVCDDTYRLFVAGERINVWNTVTFKLIKTLEGNMLGLQIVGLHLCKTTWKLYSIDEQRTITIWDTTSYRFLNQIEYDYGYRLTLHHCHSVIFLPLTNQLIVRSPSTYERHLLEVWNFETNDTYNTKSCCQKLLEDITWTVLPSNEHPLSGGYNHLLVSSMVLDRTSQILYVGIYYRRGIIVWNMTTNALVRVIGAREGDVINIGTESIIIPSDSSNSEISTKADVTIQPSVESEDNPDQESSETENRHARKLMLAPNENRLYAGYVTIIKVFDTITLDLICTIETGMTYANDIKLSTNTHRIYVGSITGQIQGWDTKTLQKVGCYEGYLSGIVDTLVTSPDTFRLYSRHDESSSEIEVWDTV